ncbi:MAG: HpaII family restriction endonuclease [Bacteroidota bacterium]
MLSGNKGEWSELYTLFKILSDKQLVVGDSNLHKIENLFFPIIKVLRDQSDGTFEYSYQDDLVLIKGGKETVPIPLKRFQEQALFLLESLKRKTPRTFSIPEIEDFMKAFHCTSLKAKSSIKSDIRVVIHDLRTGITPELGFSIKSQLGSASTLLNAGKTTNFIYQIESLSLSQDEIDEINAIAGKSKIKDRIERIRSLGGTFRYSKMNHRIFQNNLVLIDTLLPQILSDLLLLYYTNKISRTKELMEELKRLNPLDFDLTSGHPFYDYKIKRFLSDIALGMMPSTVWTGKLDATGGYLIVKEDGEILCYHIYSRNEFENYLLSNTKFETASISRHNFGSLYTEEGHLYFNLNLQIRFTK